MVDVETVVVVEDLQNAGGELQAIDPRVHQVEAPELFDVGNMRKFLDSETIRKFEVERFSTDYFNAILQEIVSEFPDRTIGIRAVIVASSEGVTMGVAGRDGKYGIATLDQILKSGGELSGLETLITRPGRLGAEGDEDTEMSQIYFRFAMEQSVLGGDRVQPAVLVYDISGMEIDSDGFGIKFVDEEAKKNALLGVYTTDLTSLTKVGDQVEGQRTFDSLAD